MPSIDIIVLTWNQKQIIQDFMESFLKHTHAPCRLIIIDQASKDGTPEYLRSLQSNSFCTIHPVYNDENKGYIGGVNQGMALSTADYVCLANNDLLFTDGWLEEVIATFESNPKIGLLNPNSNNLGAHHKTGETIHDLAKELNQKYHATFSEMPFCIGFCMFIRRDVIKKAGYLSTYLDSIFFDDTDYSMKTMDAGYLIGVAKGSYVWHKEHASFKQMGPKRQAYMVKNLRLFEEKWGRILRICWVVKSKEELDQALDQGLALARKGNYISFYTTFPTPTTAELLKARGKPEHSGIGIVRMNNLGSIVWKNIIKKKKFHLVINHNAPANALLNLAGIKTIMSWDEQSYRQVKQVK